MDADNLGGIKNDDGVMNIPTHGMHFLSPQVQFGADMELWGKKVTWFS